MSALEPKILSMEEVREIEREATLPEGCTGISAKWCPIHGDCACEPEEEGFDVVLEDPDCPLHGNASGHAETIADNSPLSRETVARLCATAEHWHREAHLAAKDREAAENWRILMSEAANDPDHTEMIERATQEFEEGQEELRLLRDLEDSMEARRALWHGAIIAPDREDSKALLRISASLEALSAFRARQKEGAA